MNPQDPVFSFVRNELLLIAEGEALRLPRREELARHLVGPGLALGEIAERRYWAHAWPHAVLPAPDYQLHGLRALLGRLPSELWALAGRAYQLVEWERTHRFCGACGKTTRRHESGEFAMVCSGCGHTAYPRISPATITVITRGREILLARNARSANGFFACIAGFVEAGESLEDCVRREVREEVGLEVGPMRYFGSQPWPFPHQLMLGFIAEYAGGELKLQEDEIAEAGWFTADNLPPLPPKVSIARQLIDAALAELA
ncbi:MAG: NAD(+) diphosphatase [Gammaproteobacteria bacterium]|nr:NAD(+) diphosphatase [Gammaproteobacteria bacterium]